MANDPLPDNLQKIVDESNLTDLKFELAIDPIEYKTFLKHMYTCLTKASPEVTETTTGGGITYHLSPDSVLTQTEVECGCGKVFDITDYSRE